MQRANAVRIAIEYIVGLFYCSNRINVTGLIISHFRTFLTITPEFADA